MQQLSEAPENATPASDLPQSENITTLDKLQPGMRCEVLEITGALRSRQKFADVGLVEGAHIRFDGRSPFGGLLRVKVMGTSMSFHSEEARHFIVRTEGQLK